MSDVTHFLEHFGIKGQRWGVRNTQKAQRGINVVRRIASGTANNQDVSAAFQTGLLSREHVLNRHQGNVSAAARQSLDRQKRFQDNVNKGKAKAFDILSRNQGIDVRMLNYSYTKPKK